MIPRHHPEPERLKALIWIWLGVGLTGAGLLASVFLIWPIAQLADPWVHAGDHRPAITESAFWERAGHWIGLWWSQDVLGFGHDFLSRPGDWWPVLQRRFLSPDASLGTMVAATVGLLLAVCPGLIWLGSQPYSLDYQSHGNARWMDGSEMQRNRLFSPTGIVLGIQETGIWPVRIRREIRNWETLSALLISPPGTGKTVQLMHNILTDWPDRKVPVPGPCMIVNDPKGELFRSTAGWRGTLGPVFRMAWADTHTNRWNPIGPKSLPGGLRARELRVHLIDRLGDLYDDPTSQAASAERILLRQTLGLKAWAGLNRLVRDWPASWRESLQADPSRILDAPSPAHADVIRRNWPLIEELLPGVIEMMGYMAEVERYIDRQCAIVIPDTIEAHWRNTGRDALAGFIGFIVARCQHAPERYGEPTLGKLLDQLNDFNPQTESAPKTEDGNVDEVAQQLQAWVTECRVNGYPQRVINDLESLRKKPDKERGSVISTAISAISIFKNLSVQQATSTSDFSLEDLRGAWDPRIGQYRPVTIYVDIPLEDAVSLGRITGLFLDWAAAGLISQKEQTFKPKTGPKRRPVVFMLDEFWTLPPLQSLQQIPALGRGQWVQLYLVGQSLSQLAQQYGAQGQNVVATLKAASSYHIFLTQTDNQAAKEVSESVGQRTIRAANVSRTLGLGKGVNPLQRNESQSYSGVPLIRPEDVRSLEKLDGQKGTRGYQIVMISGAMNRPLMARVPAFFLNKRLRRRAGLSIETGDWSEIGYAAPSYGKAGSDSYSAEAPANRAYLSEAIQVPNWSPDSDHTTTKMAS